jgi:ERCC4-type nuclease
MPLFDKTVNPESGEISTTIRQIRIVDTREPWEIQDHLIKTGWEKQTLVSGDYWFLSTDLKKVGIERKEIDDFINCIGERLNKQLDNMLEFFDIKILLIEGSWKGYTPQDQRIITPRGLQYHTWEMAWNYLRTWQDKGITIELTSGKTHTLQRLNELYAYYQKTHHLSTTRNDSGDDRVMAFPSGCRGKTALNVLNKFGSLRAVAEATITELKTVEKIGDKKALTIQNHFNYSKIGTDRKTEELNTLKNQPIQMRIE